MGRPGFLCAIDDGTLGGPGWRFCRLRKRGLDRAEERRMLERLVGMLEDMAGASDGDDDTQS
jgi:hypothetical protein